MKSHLIDPKDPRESGNVGCFWVEQLFIKFGDQLFDSITVTEVVPTQPY